MAADAGAEILADFRFAGRPGEQSGRVATADIRNAGISSRGLELLRGYENAGEGYRATFHVPKMSPDDLTLVVDLAPLRLDHRDRRTERVARLLRRAGLLRDGPNDARNLVTLGRGWRWAGLDYVGGHLRLTLNNGAFSVPLPDVVVTTRRWHRLVLSLDGPERVVRVAMDGRVLPPVAMPPGLQIRVDPDPVSELADRVVTFAHYGNGRAFHGYVARVCLLDRALSADEIAGLGPVATDSLPSPGARPGALSAAMLAAMGLLAAGVWRGLRRQASVRADRRP